jgi:predicted site-specific integrase-resolvase
MPSGTIIVHEDGPSGDENAVVIYARVSSSDQKDDLERQVERLRLFALSHGWTVSEVVREIGSGLNGQRQRLLRLLANRSAQMILVEHRDRLGRFGFEFIEAALKAQGRRFVVADETEETSDLWQDFVDVVTSMCARIYGRRSARKRAQRALKAVQGGDQAGL